MGSFKVGFFCGGTSHTQVSRINRYCFLPLGPLHTKSQTSTALSLARVEDERASIGDVDIGHSTHSSTVTPPVKHTCVPVRQPRSPQRCAPQDGGYNRYLYPAPVIRRRSRYLATVPVLHVDQSHQVKKTGQPGCVSGLPLSSRVDLPAASRCQVSVLGSQGSQAMTILCQLDDIAILSRLH